MPLVRAVRLRDGPVDSGLPQDDSVADLAKGLTPLGVLAAIVVGVGVLTGQGPGVTTHQDLPVGNHTLALTTTSWTDPASAAHLGGVLGGFMDHYSSDFDLPESMTLQVPETYGNAFYQGGRDLVKVPRNLTIGSGTKDLRASEAILSHELGHALFAHNMPGMLSMDGPQWATLRREGISLAFNELFADAAAAGFLDDPSSVAEALDFQGHDKDTCSADPRVAARDLVGEVLPDDWKEAGPHNQLAPVRSAIGGKYPQLLASPAGVRKLLDILTEAMLAEHELVGNTRFTKDDVPARNQRVLALLAKHMD